MIPFRSIARAIGSPEDIAATDSTSPWSWISLLKGIHGILADGSFAASLVGRVDTFAFMAQGAAMRAANYMKLARASRVATAADVVTTAAQVAIAVDANNFARGTALFGQRAKKDRRAAAASAAAAAASAASITSEGLVLGVQVYS